MKSATLQDGSFGSVKENHPDLLASINTQVIEEVSEDCSSNANNYSYMQYDTHAYPAVMTSSKPKKSRAY